MTTITIIPLNYSIETSDLLIKPMNGMSPNSFQVSVSHVPSATVKQRCRWDAREKASYHQLFIFPEPPPHSSVSPALSLTMALLSAQVHELCSLPGPHHAHGPGGGQHLPGFLLLCPGGIPSRLHYHPYHRPGWPPLSLGCVKYGGRSGLSSFGFYPRW